MARKSKIRRIRKAAFNISRFAENYVQAEILVRGTTGGGLMSFVTGNQDLSSNEVSVSVGTAGVPDYSKIIVSNPDGVISLKDVVAEPGLALQAMYTNGAANLIPMAVQSITTRVGFRLFRTLMSPQRRAMNELAKQVLGRGQITF